MTFEFSRAFWAAPAASCFGSCFRSFLAAGGCRSLVTLLLGLGLPGGPPDFDRWTAGRARASFLFWPARNLIKYLVTQPSFMFAAPELGGFRSPDVDRLKISASRPRNRHSRPRRRRRLGRPRGRLAVYFSRSTSGLRKPPSSGANIRKGCATKYLIKLRAGQNKNKARARPAVHLSKSGGPPGKPEPNNKVTKLRQPPPARKLRKQLPKQLAAAAQKARENSNVIKSISAYKEAGLTEICGSATGGATKTNINLKDKLYYFKVHLYHKKNKQKWFT